MPTAHFGGHDYMSAPWGRVYPPPRRELVPQILTPTGRDLGPGIPTPPHVDRMTDTSENITFLQLRWLVVTKKHSSRASLSGLGVSVRGSPKDPPGTVDERPVRMLLECALFYCHQNHGEKMGPPPSLLVQC